MGLRIGKGEKLPDIIATMNGAVAEGVLTSRAAHMLATQLHLDCPIIEGIFKVVHGERLTGLRYAPRIPHDNAIVQQLWCCW